ncbi:hypothetical protein OHA21_07910 [Actinoplanes sp. NBC_00393]|uniref:hypothetical protein n=1 Tax=Actinoplanes sp. NBC_00393 TaxID=2975953 RepID=UPI002E1FDA3C
MTLHRLAREGFVAIRSIARYGVIPAEARDLGCAPGHLDAARLVQHIAVASAFPRHLRVACGRRRWFGGRWSPAEVLAATWQLSDPLGRAWIEDRTGHHGAAADGTLRRHWADSLGALRDEGTFAARSRPSRAALAEDLALQGLAQIYRSATADRPAWQTIEVVADACHRLPILFEYPGAIAGLLYRPMLRDAWTGAGEAARTWLRDHR